MATIIKPTVGNKPFSRIKPADFRKLVAACEAPGRASDSVKARMSAAKAYIKRSA